MKLFLKLTILLYLKDFLDKNSKLDQHQIKIEGEYML